MVRRCRVARGGTRSRRRNGPAHFGPVALGRSCSHWTLRAGRARNDNADQSKSQVSDGVAFGWRCRRSAHGGVDARSRSDPRRRPHSHHGAFRGESLPRSGHDHPRSSHTAAAGSLDRDGAGHGGRAGGCARKRAVGPSGAPERTSCSRPVVQSRRLYRARSARVSIGLRMRSSTRALP